MKRPEIKAKCIVTIIKKMKDCNIPVVVGIPST